MAKSNRIKTKSTLKGNIAIISNSEYDAAMQVAGADRDDLQKSIIKMYGPNATAFGNYLLLVNVSTSTGNVTFDIINGSTTSDLYVNVKKAWDCLISKYAPTTAPKYIKLEREFGNSKLRNDEENPDTWTTNLESL